MSLVTSRPKPNTIHHKKRFGAHQKHTKGFTKTYWPYLPLFIVLIVGLAVLGGFVLGPAGAVFGVIGGAIGTVAIVL